MIWPLAERDSQPRQLVQAAAAALGLSERQTYTLLRRGRDAGGAVTALVPGTSSNGRNKPRMPPASEAALTRAIHVDHTPVDLILVDPLDRKPVGRAWLTVAIDTYSRCIVGFHVTLEAPSATSAGLCLTHAAMDKALWLALGGVEANWPMAGKPRRVGVDNGPKLHSAALSAAAPSMASASSGARRGGHTSAGLSSG